MRIVRSSLALAILTWIAACAERYVEPPIRLAPVPAALAAFEVQRPGEILLDAQARKMVLRGLSVETRGAICGRPQERWPSHGVVRTVRAPADGTPDERSEPFALTVMREAAVAYGLDDAAARRALVMLLDRWARGDGLTRRKRDEANVYYAVDRTLLPTLVAWSLVRGEADVEPERLRRIDRWLRRVARLRGDLRPAPAGNGTSLRNNHYYLSASVSMAWGALAGEDTFFRQGTQAFDQALADMRRDGSLPLETERGARALWYQRHAIASLVTIAEMAAVQGYDLYRREGPDGQSLHAAISFLLDGIDEPARVWPYAEADTNPGIDQEPHDQDLSFLIRRGHGRHYMAWVEPYAARFPARDEFRRLLALLAREDPGFRPMLDDYSGGNTTCYFAPAGANPQRE